MRRTIFVALCCGVLACVGPIGALAQEAPQQTTQTEVKTTETPYTVKYVFNRDLAPGRVKKVTDGVTGKKIVTITKVLENGKVVDTRESVEEVEKVDAVFHMGRQGFRFTDRGSFTRTKTMTVTSTAYLPTDGSGTGRTATGRKAEYGIVAVDPKVIPLGTLLFVEGYGFALAADTGGAIKGNKIDVCMHSRKDCMNWGRRKVQIHIFQGRHTKDVR